MVWFVSEWVHLLQMGQFLNLCMVQQAESFKIIRSFRVEGTLESLMWNLLLKMGSAKRTHQVAPGFVQSGIENLQELRLHNLFGHPVPLFQRHLLWKNIFLKFSLNSDCNLRSLLSQYVPPWRMCLCLLAGHPHKHWGAAVFLKPSLQAGQAHLPQLLHIRQVLCCWGTSAELTLVYW